MAGTFTDDWSDFTDIRIKCRTSLGSIMLVSLDRLPLAASRRMILVASDREMNIGIRFSRSGKKILDVGTSPLPLSPVEGIIFFKDRKGLKVRTLDLSGKRTGKADIIGDSGYDFSGPALMYEIVEE